MSKEEIRGVKETTRSFLDPFDLRASEMVRVPSFSLNVVLEVSMT